MADMSRQDDAVRKGAPEDQTSTGDGAQATDAVRRRLIQTALIGAPVILTLKSGEAHAGVSGLACYGTGDPLCVY